MEDEIRGSQRWQGEEELTGEGARAPSIKQMKAVDEKA